MIELSCENSPGLLGVNYFRENDPSQLFFRVLNEHLKPLLPGFLMFPRKQTSKIWKKKIDFVLYQLSLPEYILKYSRKIFSGTPSNDSYLHL